MYRHLQRRLAQQVRDFLLRTYNIDQQNIVIEQPPKVEMGEYALPLAFELAKQLRKAPRKIAEEIVTGIGPLEGFEKLELAGGGYINARVKRDLVAADLLADRKPATEVPAGKVLVEHSSINPNKAAHIGHLRNHRTRRAQQVACCPTRRVHHAWVAHRPGQQARAQRHAGDKHEEAQHFP